MESNFQQTLLQELKVLLAPIRAAAESELSRRQLFIDLGWNTEGNPGFPAVQLVERLSELVNGYEQLAAAVDSPPQTLLEFLEALDAVADIFEAVNQLKILFEDFDLDQPDQLGQLGQELTTLLVTRYLEVFHPIIFRLAVLLTIIKLKEDSPLSNYVFDNKGNLVRVPYRLPQLNLTCIPELLKDPIAVLKAEYFGSTGLATSADAQKAADKLFPRLGALLINLGARAMYGVKPQYGIDFGEAGNEIGSGMLTTWVNLGQGGDFEGSLVGMTLSLSSADQGDLGLVVAPFGSLTFTQSLGGWQLTLELTAGIEGFAVGPQGLVLPEGFENISVNGRISAVKLPQIEEIAYLLGSVTGTRLEIGELALSGEVSLEPGQQDFGILMEIGKAALVISPGDGDGFLQETLPPDKLRVEFDLAMGWSKSQGFFFRGSGGLEGTIPVNLLIPGFAYIDSVYLAVQPTEAAVHCITALTAIIKLGPFIVTIERLGMAAAFTFPGTGGNLGPVNMSLAFKPPDGAGLAIDAGVVTGGGYLFFDPKTEQYAGILLLEINETIMVKAIGLLATRLPDGSKGFSLLVMITVEDFPPVQLGFGFTLNGIGGLFGVNRTLSLEALQTGLKNGTLDSILFPVDPVGQAEQIIKDLSKVFPPMRGRHILSPMAILGWGNPTLMTAELGVVFELPGPSRLVVLGQLRAFLPSEQFDLIRLQVDILGVVDFDNRTLAIDAVLRDSRLLNYPLTGDLAVRASWGANPGFVLAAGGFHPRFQVPAGFPQLQRLAINLSTGDNPRLRLEAYLAITSNSLQFGARLDLYVEAAGFSLEGFLSFDTLFQFSPFQFEAGINGSVALKHDGTLLMSVTLDILLSGPLPWHVRGKATFKILLLEMSVEFDRQFGSVEQQPLPSADPLPALLQSLKDPRNWSAGLTNGDLSPVTFRTRSLDGEVPVHPAGSLSVRQQIVPLDLEISRFGNSVPSGARRFSISGAQINGVPVAVQPLTDYFAPAQFFELSDQEKLSRPSFEQLQAGLQLAPGIVTHGPALETGLEYETIMLGAEQGVATKGPLYKMGATTLEGLASSGAAARPPIKKAGRRKFRTQSVSIMVKEAPFVVAASKDLLVENLPGLPLEGSSYTIALDRLNQYVKNHPQAGRRLQVVARNKEQLDGQ